MLERELELRMTMLNRSSSASSQDRPLTNKDKTPGNSFQDLKAQKRQPGHLHTKSTTFGLSQGVRGQVETTDSHDKDLKFLARIPTDKSSRRRCTRSKRLSQLHTKPGYENDVFNNCNLSTFPSIRRSYLLFINSLSTWRLFYAVSALILLVQTVPTDAYVLTENGQDHTYLHRRLVGRERRDVQREILSILGLNHRPRPNNVRSIEKTSAPLYMLGLYSSVSRGSAQDTELDLLQRDRPGAASSSRLHGRSANRYPAMSRSAGPFTLDPMDNAFPSGIAPSLNRYIEDSGILTNEVGVFETNTDQLAGPMSFQAGGTYNGLLTNEVERRLLDESDLVMSFINTKQPRGSDDQGSPSSQLRVILKRHRPYYFAINQESSNDTLTATKFRLYKEASDQTVGNQTLRVNAYQVVVEGDGSSGIYLLGSRLVGANQEGWLVYDVTSALRDWMAFPNQNFGLKVSVETMDGRYLKPQKTGLVGRKGHPSKQAFIVAFFAQNEEDQLHEHFRRRIRRSPGDPSSDEDNQSELADDDEEDWDEEEEDPSANVNETDNTSRTGSLFMGREEIDEEILEEEEEEEEEVATTTNNSSDVVETEEESRNLSRRRARAKDMRPKKKNRRRKNRPKNSSKRKPTSEHCHRKQLYVDFRDLGWQEWIIAPTGYKAYQCLGECRFPLYAHMNATNHAIVQSLVHVTLPHMKLPKPCCSPTTLEAISVLYYNDNSNVIYKKYRNMVVKSCGCH